MFKPSILLNLGLAIKAIPTYRANSLRLTMATTLVVAISFIGMPTVVFANALEQFKRFVTETRSARGEFNQRMVKGEGDKLRVSSQSSGTFAFSRPGKFIWNYKKPYEQVLQSDGNNMYIHDQDLNQVTVRALGNAIGSSPAAILFGSNDLEKNFSLSDAGNKDGIDWLQAIPKTKDTQFERIGIGLRDGLPVGMELRDSFGQVSVINFTRFEKNPSLPANQFKFVMPKGADLLQQ